jgi:BlaI family penicillinase repressor
LDKDPTINLGRRERQIMEAIYRRGSATAGEVLEDLPEARSNSTVRTMLRLLEQKGYLVHQQDGPRYVYVPVVAKGEVQGSALRHLVRTFFDDSVTAAVATLIQSKPLSKEEQEHLTRLLAQVPTKTQEDPDDDLAG